MSDDMVDKGPDPSGALCIALTSFVVSTHRIVKPPKGVLIWHRRTVVSTYAMSQMDVIRRFIGLYQASLHVMRWQDHEPLLVLLVVTQPVKTPQNHLRPLPD